MLLIEAHRLLNETESHLADWVSLAEWARRRVLLLVVVVVVVVVAETDTLCHTAKKSREQ